MVLMNRLHQFELRTIGHDFEHKNVPVKRMVCANCGQLMNEADKVCFGKVDPHQQPFEKAVFGPQERAVTR